MRRLLQGMEELGDEFSFRDLRNAFPNVPQGSITYALKKAVTRNLVERLETGRYAKRAQDFVSAYFNSKRGGSSYTPRANKPARDSGAVVISWIGDTFLIRVGNRAFIGNEVAFVKRERGGE